MQGLVEAPREALTEGAVRALLTADSIDVRCGLHVVNTSGAVTDNLSDRLVGGKVSHDNKAAVHGACTLEFHEVDLEWGKTRVRPWMELTHGDTTARFHLGVYVLTSPELPRGETPETYKVTGYDLTYLLASSGPGDTYVVTQGDTYIEAVRDVLTDSGVDVPLVIDGTKQSSTLPNTMVWAMNQSHEVTWLEIINDLLREINYVGLWADHRGRYRSGPHRAAELRPIEWLFNTLDARTNIVGEDRKMLAETYGIPNWWRFIRQRQDTKPTEGDGIYTVTNQSTGPTSIDRLGRVVRKRQYLDAADHASLVEQGDVIVAQDTAYVRTFEVKVDPLPIAGHLDVVRLRDSGRDDVCSVATWDLDLNGGQTTWVLEAVNS